MHPDIRDLHPADIAENFSYLDGKSRNLSFMMLPGDIKSEVFPYFDPITQQEIIKSLGDKEFAEILNSLAPDDRTAIFDTFPDELIKQSVNLLNEHEKEVALNLIGYPKDCIARLMTPHYVQAKEHWTVQQVLDHIKKHGRKAETLNFIYVVDEQNKLIDELRIGQLLMADYSTPLKELMDYTYVSIRTTTPIEEAFTIFEKYDRAAIPIVTENGTLVGIVTFDDILENVTKRDTEDIQKFGGLEELDLSYTQTPWLTLVRKRASWLIILFLGEMLTASAMGHYDEQIEKAVVLALFVPLIIASGGNSGSQAASLIIRAMALQEVKLKDWWYVMRKEILSGLLLGSVLGSIGFLRILVWQKASLYDYGEYWLWVGITVSVALIFIVLWGTLAGSMIPFILKKFGLDPATASAPFVATLVDVTGLVIYFNIAAIFLSGKIL